MARKRVSTPMLEDFLRSSQHRSYGVMPEWVPAVVWIVIGLLAWFTLQGWPATLAGIAVGGGVAWWLRRVREVQIHKLPPGQRHEYDKWSQVAQLRGKLSEGKLSSYVPVPILEELEATARTRFAALDQLDLLRWNDPELVALSRAALDDELALAIASVSPVVRTGDQGYSHVRTWEQDGHLMTTVCRRVATRRARIEEVLVGLQAATPDARPSLLDQLARASDERLVAEAELDASLEQRE